MKNGKRTCSKKIPTLSGRRLFMVDIENFVGKALITDSDVTLARLWAEREFRLTDTDFVVVGTSGSTNCLAAASWAGARHVYKPGHDGADLALCEAVKDYRLDTFDEVVIMSGDGIFTEVADSIAASGPIVTVVSVASRLSRCLARAGSRVQFLTPYALAA